MNRRRRLGPSARGRELLLIVPSSTTVATAEESVELLMMIDPDLALSDGLAVNRWSQLTLTDREVRIRAAVGDDAPAMGRVMVESFLAAHRGQMPDAAWQKRVEEWTPEVSARGWSRTLAEQGGGTGARIVLLVAEDDAGVLIGLVFGSAVDEEPSRSIAEIGALYVLPDRRGQGVGGSMLRAASRELAALGFSALHVGVLSANLPARTFYEAMGGCEIGSGTSDERGNLLPLTIYGWSDIGALIGRSSETSRRQ